MVGEPSTSVSELGFDRALGERFPSRGQSREVPSSREVTVDSISSKESPRRL
jgi:hypothetical protein